MESVADKLGVGIYSVAEAARYARVSTKLVDRWIFGTGPGDAVISPQARQEKVITFIDFVQTMAIRAIRQVHKVPLQKIRQAVQIAEQEYGLSHPFARKHTTFLAGAEISIKIGIDEQGQAEYVEASGPHRRNRLLTKVVEIYLLDLTFDDQSLASQYCAFRYGDAVVDMKPTIRFGEPLVTSCGYSAQTLWEASKSEGSIEAAAKAYGVRAEEIEVACRYYDYLLGKSAA
jgi:uncharacterized protein (DUF433 family)